MPWLREPRPLREHTSRAWASDESYGDADRRHGPPGGGADLLRVRTQPATATRHVTEADGSDCLARARYAEASRSRRQQLMHNRPTRVLRPMCASARNSYSCYHLDEYKQYCSTVQYLQRDRELQMGLCQTAVACTPSNKSARVHATQANKRIASHAHARSSQHTYTSPPGTPRPPALFARPSRPHRGLTSRRTPLASPPHRRPHAATLARTIGPRELVVPRAVPSAPASP